MSAEQLERALAGLYANPKSAAAFPVDPHSYLRDFDLTAEERRSLVDLDRTGFHFAVDSFARKRSLKASKHCSPVPRSLLRFFGR